MGLFHDEDDGPNEVQVGLPQPLPEGEDILYQGSADPRALILAAMHVRAVAFYIGAVIMVRSVIGAGGGESFAVLIERAAEFLALGGVAVGILSLLGWWMAKRSVFTITNRRVVIRHGIAIRKYINIPFDGITSVDLKPLGRGTGNIALKSEGRQAVPYFHLWPFASPMRFTKTIPVLRALPKVDEVAPILVDAIRAAAPSRVEVARPAASAEPAAKTGHPALTPEVSLP